MRYSLFVLLLGVNANSADTWKPVVQSECRCSFPGVRQMPLLPHVADEGWNYAADRVAAAGRVIMDFYHAHIQAGEAVRPVLHSLACHECDKVSAAFTAYQDANYQAFSKRIQADLRDLPEQALNWADSTDEDFGREKWDDSEDPLGLATACRRPEAPKGFAAPVAKGKLPAAAVKALEDLQKDTEQFNEGLRAGHEAFLGMLPYERAYDCREVLEAYDALVKAEREAFVARKDGALADVARHTVQWRVEP